MKIFDAHFHIINPDFPLVENNGYLPPAFTVKNYKQQTKEFNSVGGAIVSGSFQAFDQEYLIHALQKVGNNYVGVANIPFNLADKELRRLQNSNIVAVRFNLKRGGSETIDKLPQLSNKLFDDYGWHTELYVDAKNLKELNPLLSKIQKFSIDHLGLSKEGLSELYAWVEKGVRVKATGFGRVNFNPIPVMRQIYDINPKALLFGTDLPSTRAKIPFSQKDINIIIDNFSISEQENIFYKNAQQWYNKSRHF